MPRSSAAKILTLLAGERADGETDSAIIACNDWLRLGPGRTLPLLLQKYTKTRQNTPPTTSLDTLKSWSRTFGWKDRSPIYDQAVEDAKNARREAIMAEGLALDYERVALLKRLGRAVAREVFSKRSYKDRDETVEYSGLWVHDVKSIGTGDAATVHHLLRPSGLLTVLRGTLSDLAAEQAGRGKRKDGEEADPLARLNQAGIDYGQFSDADLLNYVAAGEAQADESDE